MNFKYVNIETIDLPEAWTRLIWNCFEYGREYFIDEGSRAGQKRLTMDFANAVILKPENRPFYPLSKDGCVSPVDDESVEKYFLRYIHCNLPPEPNEHYNYSEYIFPLSKAIINHYVTKGFGNAHCVIRVGDPFCFLNYSVPYKDEMSRKTTPCLLSIDTKIIESDKAFNLVFYVVYRSWDLFSGFLLNNAGFQLQKESMAIEISELSGKEVLPGPTVVSCKDLHLYEEDWSAAAMWAGKKL